MKEDLYRKRLDGQERRENKNMGCVPNKNLPGDKQLSVSWNANTESVDGYKVHWGTTSGNYTNSTDVGKTTAYTIAGLTNGVSYYISVTAYADIKETYFYHIDHLGTPILMTNGSGTIIWDGELLPFGERPLVKGNITNNLGFLGQYFDEETGKHYNWNRYYDPKAGRYISEDPIGLAGGINLYVYVGNNPVNFVDPLGLFNPTKAVSALLNSLNSGRLYASGSIKIAAAAGLDLTGVGIPAGTGVFLLGSWNIYSGTAAQRRAMQQWEEALNEKWSDATWKNLLGVLPFGEQYDDPCEPMPGEFLKRKSSTLKGKASDILELLKELGTLGW